MIISRFTLLGAILTTLVCISSAQAAGKFYKWTDDKGVVHYGENPPNPDDATKVNVHVGRSSDEAVEALDEQRKDKEVATKQASADAEKQKVEDENARIMQENCKIYQQNLSTLKASSRIREKDEKGNYRYLTDEEKAAKEQEAQSYLDTNCAKK